MPWLNAVLPVRMTRVALVAPDGYLRPMLVKVAEAGCVEIDADTEEDGSQVSGAGGAGAARGGPALSVTEPDLAALAREGREDLIAGETQLRHFAAGALVRHSACGLAGWMPAERVGALSQTLAGIGCAVVPLRRPRGIDAPTLMTARAGQRAIGSLVSTYGTVPYADISPGWLAFGSYVLMFGMMFGDVGDGLLLVAAAIVMRFARLPWLSPYRAAWPFVAGAGVAATAFGFAYGEFFGPTGVIPVLWLDPIESPITLLVGGLAFGAVLLAGAYALGVVNRWREGGLPLALYSSTGIAGAALFLGLGALAGGWYLHSDALLIAGGVVVVSALALAFTGFVADAGGGGYGVTQASVEVFDLVVRLGSNIASFARLAAFGLAHAALGLLVWQGTVALWRSGGLLVPLAVVLFLAGSALAFALEGLVAAVQALRLEYYELFSRIFVTQGRPFRPWHLRIDTGEAGLVHNDDEAATVGADGSPGQGEV